MPFRKKATTARRQFVVLALIILGLSLAVPAGAQVEADPVFENRDATSTTGPRWGGRLQGDAGSTRLPGPRWKAGDSIDSPTMFGNTPSWRTVQRRYWKNRADSAVDGEFSQANLDLMGRGRAPRHDELDVPMELHHIDPRRSGGSNAPDNLQEVWPWVHDDIDPFRHYGGPRP